MLGFAFPIVTWIRTGKPWQRLADVDVPNGILLSVLLFALAGRRRTARIYAKFGEQTAEFGTFIGNRMRQSDERSSQLLDLQASLERYASAANERDEDLLRLSSSVERLTRWLVRLTILLGAIGVAGVAVAVWAALR